MTKFRVQEGAAPEIYGREVKAGDTISLGKMQAEHLLAKGHIAPVEAEQKPEEPVVEDPAPTDPLASAQRDAAKGKGGNGGNRA